MNVLRSANLSALWASIMCTMGYGASKKIQSPRRPQILCRSVMLLLFFLGLAYTCQVFTWWLGISSYATPFLQVTPYDKTWPLLTRQVNETLCNTTGPFLPFANDTYLCGLTNIGYAF